MAKSRSRRKAPTFPLLDTHTCPNQRWFSRDGYVLTSGGRCEVVVGGSLIGWFEKGDCGPRNVLLIALAQNSRIGRDALAQAFGISAETVRLICKQYEEEGLAAVVARARGGSESKVSPAMRRRMEALFEEGLSIDEVHARVKRRCAVSRSTVGNVRKSWAATRVVQPVELRQAVLPLAQVEARPETERANVEGVEQRDVSPERGEIRSKGESSERCGRTRGVAVGEQLDDEESEPLLAQLPGSTRGVQFAGAWLMVAMVAALGLHRRAAALLESARGRQALRMALDAVTIALAIGEKHVEGVRRLATSTCATLLMTTSAPSAKWVRQILGAFSAHNVGSQLHFGVAGDLIRAAGQAAEASRPTVFYVDNHCRPYTGKERLCKGWRMQDRRARPGTADYYVSDAQGIPQFRVTVPTHGSLSKVLRVLAAGVQHALGKQGRLLLCFDRGGAFPAPMSGLKSGEVDFITYERAPCGMPTKKRLLAEGLQVVVRGEGYRVIESRANLGNGRGRVRRLSVLTPEGRRLNALASSEQDAAWLLSVLFGRWNQENGFKHGVERWGMNVLDGRKVQPYPPGTIIPNPARSRLERELKALREREGELRRKLARPIKRETTRSRLQAALDDALARQQRLENRRASVPERIAIEESELRDELVCHSPEYKTTIDTIRIACANAEEELAAMLAPVLSRPREAKKALRNLFGAPGTIRAGSNSITVTLDPAGTRDEKQAFAQFLSALNRRRLVHPGDPMGRPLRFRVQIA